MPVSETSEINIDLSSEKVSLLDGATEEMTTTDVNCDGAPVILPDNRWCDASGAMPVSETSEINIDLSSEKVSLLDGATEEMTTTDVNCDGAPVILPDNSGAMPVSETSEINIDLSSEKVSLLDGATEEMTTTDVNCDGAPVILPDNSVVRCQCQRLLRLTSTYPVKRSPYWMELQKK
ncbi:hypothetical protein ACROYT_G009525 [Oculina patagonica]